jgi:hypothetical protein
MQFNKKIFFRWAKIIIIIYCIIGIALYYAQDYFLLKPVKLSPNHLFQFTSSFEEFNIPINQTDTVNLIRFFPADDTVPKGVVIYFHKGMGNVENYEKETAIFLKNNYEVWIPDYPGFGKSSGTINEHKLYEQAFQVKRLASKRFHQNNVILYGDSFGAAIASYIANDSAVKTLILENPYFSLPYLYNSFAPIYPVSMMSNFKLSTGDYLLDVKCPIAVFYGTNNDKLSNSFADKLNNNLKGTDKIFLVKVEKNKKLYQSDNFQKVIDSLLR